MHDPTDPPPPPLPPPPPPGGPRAVPVRYPMPPPPPPRSSGRALLILLLLGSIVLNVVLCGSLIRGISGDESNVNLRERFVAGSPTVKDKVAVIRVEGMLMEGMLSYPYREIEEAAEDKEVKAVVLRIESPGGTITSSDDLLKRLQELREGTSPRLKSKNVGFPKPIVVSMGNVAASGGYYIAMAAAQDPKKAGEKKIFAERSTLTGSIGVYASFPNVSELTHKY